MYSYQAKYLKYKAKYLNLKYGGGDGTGPTCGKHPLEVMPGLPTCDKKGGIDFKTKVNVNGKKQKYYGWDLPSYLTCSQKQHFKKHEKPYQISSGTVVVGDILRHNKQTGQDITNVKLGSYNLYTYGRHEKRGKHTVYRREICVSLHSDYGVDDITKMDWECHDWFTTDIANGGIYDKAYYGKPSEMANIKEYAGAPNDRPCIEKEGRWMPCKEHYVLEHGKTVLPHGFFVLTTGDGGFKMWKAKDGTGKVVGFGFVL